MRDGAGGKEFKGEASEGGGGGGALSGGGGGGMAAGHDGELGD